MTDWYYHAPGQGRVGPLTAEQMRERFRERRILRDTLAWHEGLREWQPVERLIEELGLTGVEPDLSRPPPPPPPRPSASGASHASRPSVRLEPPPSNRTGCILVVVIVGVLGLIALGVIAAIALPEYKRYVERSRDAQAARGADATTGPVAERSAGEFDAERMADTEALARELVSAAMREFYAANGNVCPEEYEFERLLVRRPRWQGDENGWFVLDPARPESGVCAYDVRFRGLGAEVEKGALRYEVDLSGDEVAIACRNAGLATEHVPIACGS